MAELSEPRPLAAPLWPMRLVRVALTLAEADAVLRALDLVRLMALARNRREQPRAVERPEEAAEEKLLQAMSTRGSGP